MLLYAGYQLVRTKGSHRIYRRGNERVVLPFHARQTLHPKIVKQVQDRVAHTTDEEAREI